jgi:hypothetical protein
MLSKHSTTELYPSSSICAIKVKVDYYILLLLILSQTLEASILQRICMYGVCCVCVWCVYVCMYVCVCVLCVLYICVCLCVCGVCVVCVLWCMCCVCCGMYVCVVCVCGMVCVYMCVLCVLCVWCVCCVCGVCVCVWCVCVLWCVHVCGVMCKDYFNELGCFSTCLSQRNAFPSLVLGKCVMKLQM